MGKDSLGGSEGVGRAAGETCRTAACGAGGATNSSVTARAHILDAIGEYVYPAPGLAAKQYFIKIIRGDDRDYWLVFLRENTKTPLNHRSDSPKRETDSAYKTQYTSRLLAGSNVYEIVKRDERSPQYSPDIKQGHKSQSLSYVDEENNCLPLPFQYHLGPDAPFVGVRIARESVLLNRIFFRARGSRFRPYDAPTEAGARQKQANLFLQNSLDELAKKASGSNLTNEVLARVLAIDAITIAKDNIDSRLLAQVRLDLLNERLRIIEDCFALDSMTLGERKIIFYLPGNALHNTEYTAAEQAADRDSHLEKYTAYVTKYADKKDKYLNTSGISAIHKAAALGKSDEITTPIDPDELNATDSLGRSALHFAAMNGQGDTLLLLLSQEEISVNQDDCGDDFLQACLTNKRPDYAKKALLTLIELPPEKLAMLLDKGLSVGYVLSRVKLSLRAAEYDSAYKAFTRAFEYCQDGNKERIVRESGLPNLLETYLADDAIIVENPSLLLFKSIAWGSAKSHMMLIEKGAQNHTNADRVSTLHCAARCGCALVVTTLLEQGAAIDAADSEGWTALHEAADRGHNTITDLLISSGAVVDAKNNKGRTALHVAADLGHVTVVTALLSRGADVNAKSKVGETTLHIAAYSGHVDIVNLLRGKGAPVDAKNNKGETALHIAAEQGHADTVTALLAAGAPVDAKTEKDFTALHVAAEQGHADIVTALLDAGVPVDAKTKKGFTALHVAAEQGHTDVVTALLSRGADVNAMADDSWAVLHIAAYSGHVAVVRVLLNAGASVDIKHDKGWTALYIAARSGHVAVVTALLSSDVDVDATDYNGWTALHIAAKNGHARIERLLLSASFQKDMAVFLRLNASYLEKPLFWGIFEACDDIKKFCKLYKEHLMREKCSTSSFYSFFYSFAYPAYLPKLQSEISMIDQVMSLLEDFSADSKKLKNKLHHYKTACSTPPVVQKIIARILVIKKSASAKSDSTPMASAGACAGGPR